MLRAIACVAVVASAVDAGAQVATSSDRIARERSTAHRLLASFSPVDQAWGAWHAGNAMLQETIPRLENVVAQRVGGGGNDDEAALDLALDALIQLKAEISPGLLLTVHERRPAQAFLLLSHVSEESTASLFTILRSTRGLSWFAAANLLLHRRAVALTGGILSGLELRAHIVISDNGGLSSGYGGGGGFGCGVVGSARGLPPWPSYRLRESPAPGFGVIAVGPKPIFYERVVAPGAVPSNSIHEIHGPTATDRIAYAASVAGIAVSSLPLRGDESHSVAWKGRASLNQEVARISRDMQNRYSLVLGLLVGAGTLTLEEAAALDSPVLRVTMADLRGRSGQ